MSAVSLLQKRSFQAEGSLSATAFGGGRDIDSHATCGVATTITKKTGTTTPV